MSGYKKIEHFYMLPCLECLLRPVCFQGIKSLPKDQCLEYINWRNEGDKFWREIFKEKGK